MTERTTQSVWQAAGAESAATYPPPAAGFGAAGPRPTAQSIGGLTAGAVTAEEMAACGLTFDVAIVGAGITGLTAAALLAQAGRRVVVLEAARLGAGTSGRTTAHLDPTTDVGLARLIERFGPDSARQVINLSLGAIDQIEALAREYAIDCDLQRVPAWIYTEGDDTRWLDGERRAAQELGLEAALEETAPLPFTVRAALRVEKAGRFHIMRYLAGLAAGLTQRYGDRFRLYEETPVQGIEEEMPLRLKTVHGDLLARDVILATHSPLGLRLAVHTRLEPWRSYVLGVRVTEAVPEGIFWDTLSPYHYLRRFSSDDPHLLLLGGEDHKTGATEDTFEPFNRLEAYARERFHVEAVEYHWSAELFVPVDDLPYIGLNPGSDHLYIATGYAGTGMTLGTVGGMLNARLILGEAPAAAALFSPARLGPLASAGKFVSLNLDAATHFIKDKLTGGARTRLGDLPLGAGRIIQFEGEKVAAYRDDAGELHLLSPVCPHAKCNVAWNPAERTWDCPCHGSIFSATGQVRSGPAMHGLERLDKEEERYRKTA